MLHPSSSSPSPSSTSSTSSPSTWKGKQQMETVREHIIEIPEIDLEHPEEYPPRSTSPVSPPFQQPPASPKRHASPRRRYHPFSPTNYDVTAAYFDDDDHHYHNHNNHRTLMGQLRARLIRFLGPRYDRYPLLFLAVAFLVIIGFFLIWWFAPRVSIKDSKLAEIYSSVKPFSLDEPEIYLSRKAILAQVATSPNPKIQLLMSVTDEDAYSMSNKQGLLFANPA